MSNQATDPVWHKNGVLVEGEAEGYVRVEFHLESASHKTTPIHMAECGIGTIISGLKADLHSLESHPKCSNATLEERFNIPAEQQIWTLRNHVLDDTKTLKCFGITGTENASRVPVRIVVKRSS